MLTLAKPGLHLFDLQRAILLLLPFDLCKVNVVANVIVKSCHERISAYAHYKGV